MSPTKKAPVVINRAGEAIGGWDSPLSKPTADGGKSYVCFDFPVGERVKLDAKYVGWTLELSAKGFTFEDGEREAKLEAGETLVIVADRESPPLSEAELHRAYSLCMAALEHGGFMPPWLELEDEDRHDDYYDEPWRWVAIELGRPEDSHATLGEMVCNASCYASKRGSWLGHYARYAARQKPSPIAGAEGLQLALDEDQLALVAYFRALDRFPGGNADMHTLKYTLRFVDGEARLSANHCANWDGSHTKNDTPLELPAPVAALLDRALLAPLVALFEAEAPGRQSLELVDSYEDEYALEAAWSSVELLVYARPEPGASPSTGMMGYPADAVEQGPLLFRVHLCSTGGPGGAKEHSQAHALLDGLCELLGMGDAASFADGACAAARALDAPKRGNWDGTFDWPYVMPLYLHDCEL